MTCLTRSALGGATPPADFNGKTFEKSTTDKARIVEELNRSWEFAQKTINGMSNADFAKLLPRISDSLAEMLVRIGDQNVYHVTGIRLGTKFRA
jgi:hypothetical protein